RPRARRRDDRATAPPSPNDGAPAQPPTDGGVPPSRDTDPPAKRGAGVEAAAGPGRSGLVPGLLAGICLVIVAATSRVEAAAVGRLLIPAAAILGAIAFGQVLSRRHPDEPWLPKLLVAAVVVKLLGPILAFSAFSAAEGFQGAASISEK